jgi:hypothetical protein
MYRAFSGVLAQFREMKTKTNMKTTENPVAPNTTPLLPEPTRDEIALAAFLAWERDGRQPGRELDYWLEAEGQLRLLRLKKAEAAAAQAALPWPRSSGTTEVKKPAATQKLTTAVTRSTAPKSSPAKISRPKSSVLNKRSTRAA